MIAPASAATFYLWQHDFTSDPSYWQGPVTHIAAEGTATAARGRSPGGSAFVATSGTQISDEGWYTMQHTFRDAGGVLAVDLTLLDRDGQVVYTTTRSNPADAMSGVGGNRYGWFATNNVPGGVEMDSQELYLIEDLTRDDCKGGGHANYGFSSPGQCVSWVQANPNAGK